MDKNALEQLLSSYNWWMGASVKGPPNEAEFIRLLVMGLRVHTDGVEGDWKPAYSEVTVMVGVKPIVGLRKEWLHK